MHIFISCGETSGDKYGAAIVEAITAIQPNAQFSANGGQYLKASGVNLINDVVGHSTIGFLEPIKHLPYFFSIMRKTKAHLLNIQPKVVILIDHQGFNIPLAKWCFKQNIRVVSLFSPQHWLWGSKKRAIQFSNFCDKIFCVFKQEYDYYKNLNVNHAKFIGHPLVDLIPNKDAERSSVIGLFPGSREQEIHYLLPLIMKSAESIKKKYPFVTFKMAVASHQMASLIKNQINHYNVEIKMVNDSRSLINEAWCSIVSSGTITLEHALSGTPCISLYKMNPVSYLLAKLFIWHKIEKNCSGYFSLPNILLGKKVIPEFIQKNANVNNVVSEITQLTDKRTYEATVRQLLTLRASLSEEISPITVIGQDICRDYL